jgi:hypothetical protein
VASAVMFSDCSPVSGLMTRAFNLTLSLYRQRVRSKAHLAWVIIVREPIDDRYLGEIGHLNQVLVPKQARLKRETGTEQAVYHLPGGHHSAIVLRGQTGTLISSARSTTQALAAKSPKANQTFNQGSSNKSQPSNWS